MKRVGLCCAAFGLMALVGSAASAAPWGSGSFHNELEHRAYYRELEHRDAHRYSMSGRQHERLHDALEHEAYHDRLEHRAVHLHEGHYHPVYQAPIHGSGYAHSTFVATPARGLGISTPRFSFWITK